MSRGAAEHWRANAFKNGMVHWMEDAESTKRFNNKMRMDVLGSTAALNYRGRTKTKSFTLSSTRVDEHSCRIDWEPVDASWAIGRLEFGEADGVERMLEDRKHLLNIHESYSAADVARRLMEHRSLPPLSLIHI